MKKIRTEKGIMTILGLLSIPNLFIPWFAFSDHPLQMAFIKFWTLPAFGMGAALGLIFMFSIRLRYKLLAKKFVRIYITVSLLLIWLAEIGLIFIVLYLPYNGWYFYTSQCALFVGYWLTFIGKQWGLKILLKGQQ